MNGVILYADDDVLNTSAYEYKLFEKFNRNSEYSILPINNISDLKNTVQCISTFRALLLDWSFKKPKEDEDFPDENENPLEFLKTNRLYSLVYIYSREDIPEVTKSELRSIYGDDKIYFEQKASDQNVDNEFEKIIEGITKFEDENKHMEIPYIWSQAIDQSAQTIFSELEQADSNWIKEIRDTAVNDEGDPVSEIIDIFQNILNESLIQNSLLRKALDDYQPSKKKSMEENTAKLYRRIFYSRLTQDSPIMTGDIFKFDKDKYGILITPECEIGSRRDIQLEFLILSQIDFDDFLIKSCSFNRTQNQYQNANTKVKERLEKLYNNDTSSTHILPSFPFNDISYNQTACVNFKTAFTIKTKEEFQLKRWKYKLNAPYINQLRQRYIAFFGRYGVPATPYSLRSYNLKQIEQ